MTGKAPKPWVKLWREERGSFAHLPLYTRALAAELLKLADEDGAIGIGAREPWEAVCWLLGATRGDRRMVRRDVDALLADGYLEHDAEGCRLLLPGWSRWQGDGHEATTKRPRPSNDPSTTEQRPVHDGATTEQRPSNEDRPNSSESHEPILQEGEKRERREEGEGEARAPMPRGLDETVRKATQRLLDEHEVATDSPDFMPLRSLTAPIWAELARWCTSQGAKDGLDPKRVAALVITGWADSERVIAKGHPLSWLKQSPREWYLAGIRAEEAA